MFDIYGHENIKALQETNIRTLSLIGALLAGLIRKGVLTIEDAQEIKGPAFEEVLAMNKASLAKREAEERARLEKEHPALAMLMGLTEKALAPKP